jgi:hypothetical protein
MLRRPTIARTTACAAAVALLAGCQDYNFNPVGKCIIQPGASRIKIANLSTADILFVVDDSGSMEPAQTNLANNFDAFIGSLAATQTDRLSKALDPLDFHIAITTSSIFENQAAGSSCTGGTCTVPAFTPYHQQEQYACTPAGALCGDFMTVFHHRSGSTCVAGVSADNTPYPSGDFVASTGSPKVLHFTKTLDWAHASTDSSIQALVQQFQKNIAVGSCGSSEEQHFEAAHLAVEKALAQNGLKQPADVLSTDWPHAGAKMVVVWVGNEDDCSNPGNDAASTIVLSGNPGNDTCTQNPDKLTPVSTYADYFTGLGRPFGAAFIYSAVCTTTNGVKTCAPSACDCSPPQASGACGQGAGNRFSQLSKAFQSKGISTVEASVCDSSFASTLQSIAELVKPPPGLTLPSQPAASQVALLRIESADQKTSRLCAGPAASDADRAKSDWWFVDCNDPSSAVQGAPTSCIFINHTTGHCEPNPGETYVAQYLGLVPPPSATSPQGGCAAVSDCQAALGGTTNDWNCVIPTAGGRGTCVCNGG